jgi:hyperosmotically inducible protein
MQEGGGGIAMSFKRTTFTTAGIMPIIAISLLTLLDACTGTANSAPAGQKAQATKVAESTLQEPKAAPPPEAKTADPKPKDPKEKVIPPKSPGDEAKPPAAAAKPGGESLILTVKLALMADPRLFPYEIEVDLKGQEAVLSGSVSTEEEKKTAAVIAQGVDGIKKVVNNLKVVKEASQDLNRKRDERITQQIKERFKKSKTLDEAGFEIKTQNGVVALSGKTRYQVIILEAAEAARQIPGVRAVQTGSIRLEASS